MNLDNQFHYALDQILTKGTETLGRTETSRIRLLGGAVMKYDCSDGKMSAFTLRANNPNLAIAETMAFLMGAGTVSDLVQAHPSLKLWSAWAGDGEYLGNVYGREFKRSFPKVIHGLINNPLSTHHRMTTLIPCYFPVPGMTYTENVDNGRYSLMPCLHSYHYLSDGETLHMHATQASGDMPVGVFPHNAYQVQFMLLLTAHLTGLKPGTAIHHIHDAHIYTNQVTEVKRMLARDSFDERIEVTIQDFDISELHVDNLSYIRNWVKTSEFATHPAISMKVDS